MTGPHYLPPWATRPVELCRDCGHEPRDGERHGLGVINPADGEVVEVTCLDGDGEVLLRPEPWAGTPVAPDPWSTPSDEPPPF